MLGHWRLVGGLALAMVEALALELEQSLAAVLALELGQSLAAAWAWGLGLVAGSVVELVEDMAARTVAPWLPWFGHWPHSMIAPQREPIL